MIVEIIMDSINLIRSTHNGSPFVKTRHGNACKEIISQAEEVIIRVSEKEKKIIEAIAEALPNMSERDKGYFLGYAEAKANQKEEEQSKEAEKEVK